MFQRAAEHTGKFCNTNVFCVRRQPAVPPSLEVGVQTCTRTSFRGGKSASGGPVDYQQGCRKTNGDTAAVRSCTTTLLDAACTLCGLVRRGLMPFHVSSHGAVRAGLQALDNSLCLCDKTSCGNNNWFASCCKQPGHKSCKST